MVLSRENRAVVICSGPNTSDDEPNPGFELFPARPAMSIPSDGFLNHDLSAANQIASVSTTPG